MNIKCPFIVISGTVKTEVDLRVLKKQENRKLNEINTSIFLNILQITQF